jgi:hypothetical protein
MYVKGGSVREVYDPGQKFAFEIIGREGPEDNSPEARVTLAGELTRPR